MGKMNEQNHRKKKKGENEKEEDIVLDENGIPVGLPVDKIKELAPTLYDEMAQGKSAFEIDEISNEDYIEDELDGDTDFANETEYKDEYEEKYSNPEIKVKTKTKYEKDYLEGFDPSAVDFIRRAKTIKEALEIIEYLEKRKELDTDQALELKTKLEKNGLESFGSHKKHGYYFQLAEDQRLKDKMKLIKRKDRNSTINNS
jgi:hypothetical protein